MHFISLLSSSLYALAAIAKPLDSHPTLLVSNSLTGNTIYLSHNLTGTPVYLSPKSPNYARGIAAASSPKPTLYQVAALANHNAHRKNHSAPVLTWDADLVAAAKALAQRCVWQHNTSIDDDVEAYGQNLAAGWDRQYIGSAVTDGWYGEMPAYAGQYGKATPDMSIFDEYGHFTQLVWVNSRTVGCATHNCSMAPRKGLIDPSTGKVMEGLNMFTVCNYAPPGNYLGQFAQNVKKSLGMKPYTPTPY